MDRIFVADLDQTGPFVAQYPPQFSAKGRQISGRRQQAIAFVEQKSLPRRDVVDATTTPDIFDTAALTGHDEPHQPPPPIRRFEQRAIEGPDPAGRAVIGVCDVQCFDRHYDFSHRATEPQSHRVPPTKRPQGPQRRFFLPHLLIYVSAVPAVSSSSLCLCVSVAKP